MKLSVLQWNVWYKEKPANIANLIKELNPDIICVQELIEHFQINPQIDTAKEIATELGYSYYYRFADRWTNRAEKETQGNAIFSRFPIIKTDYFYLQEPKTNPANATVEGRVVVELTIDANGRQLTFGTVHLSYSPFLKMTEQRLEEAKRLIEFLKQKKENYIFTGDLNAKPDTFLIKGISELESFKHAGPDFSEKTWTTKPFEKQGFIENDLNWRLDYVFMTQDIEVVKAEVIKTEFSDHLPILVKIKI